MLTAEDFTKNSLSCMMLVFLPISRVFFANNKLVPAVCCHLPRHLEMGSTVPLQPRNSALCESLGTSLQLPDTETKEDRSSHEDGEKMRDLSLPPDIFGSCGNQKRDCLVL